MTKTKIRPFQEIFNLYFHGKYCFEDFIATDVKKHTKKHDINNKIILSADKKLKEFHQFINVFIVNQLEFNDSVCFSYAKNTTTHTCLEPHKNNTYFLSMDIVNFFGSICNTDITRVIEHNIKQKKINISDIEKYTASIVKLITFEGVLPIGFTTSGRISNAILFEFDKKILDYCSPKNITYSRYADDLIFSGNDTNIGQVKSTVKNILTDLFDTRLNINNDKTKTYFKNTRIKILGMVITPNGKITIDKKIKSDIEIAMYFYVSDSVKFEAILEKKFNGNMHKIFGIIAYINSVDKDYLNKLRKKYGNYTVESFLRKSAK
ncbi:MAG: RNA-directed DNA polymerase [Gammaproteobacteria bacterium]|nr:RNA-directed DNA polymerase [Gammaproteobacteria bacterium]